VIREAVVSSATVPTTGLVSAPAMNSSAKPEPVRDAALDFTKGMLVLLMVLYHWLNYFVSNDSFYRYIRFITPSFIFLAGFLVTNVLASRADRKSSVLAARLFMRGAKLLALFTLLNLGVAGLGLGGSPGGRAGLSGFIAGVPSTYLSGLGSTAVFFVLVPIGYTLMLSGLLHKARDLHRLGSLVPTLLLFFVGFGAILLGVRSPTLELIGSGLLGLILGSVLAGRLHHLRRLWPWMLIAYVIHLAAITAWGVPHALQLVAVCLNLWLLYCLAGLLQPSSATARLTSLVGQYTLLGYVGQIAILQLLAISFRLVDFGSVEPALALVAALLLTVAAIATTDFLRRRARPVDSLYRLVFA
jgi:hypothetical protein